MKKRLKVSDKNKLGERRKLIIHNRQFTWMSTAEKLKLPSSKKEKSHFQTADISALLTVVILNQLYYSKACNKDFGVFLMVRASNSTARAFIYIPQPLTLCILSSSASFPETKIKLSDLISPPLPFFFCKNFDEACR